MSSTGINEAARAQVRLEAAEWVARLHDDDARTRDHEDFIDWVRRSKLHLAAFMAADDTFSRLEHIDPHRQWQLDSSVPPKARWRVPVAAAAALALLGCAALYGLNRHGSHDFATKTGEQRVVKLADGSVMMLNTRSKARVEFSAHERRIVLERGEALFTVARDPRRAFSVLSNGTQIRALGTQFRVYQHASATTVTVIEGAVQVLARPSSELNATSSQSVATSGERLSAGEQVDVDRSGRIIKQLVAPISETLAWRERQLVFRGTAIADIAAEFNRYNESEIKIADPQIAQRKMSGTFDMDRPEALVAYLERDETVRIEKEHEAWVIRRR